MAILRLAPKGLPCGFASPHGFLAMLDQRQQAYLLGAVLPETAQSCFHEQHGLSKNLVGVRKVLDNGTSDDCCIGFRACSDALGRF